MQDRAQVPTCSGSKPKGQPCCSGAWGMSWNWKTWYLPSSSRQRVGPGHLGRGVLSPPPCARLRAGRPHLPAVHWALVMEAAELWIRVTLGPGGERKKGGRVREGLQNGEENTPGPYGGRVMPTLQKKLCPPITGIPSSHQFLQFPPPHCVLSVPAPLPPPPCSSLGVLSLALSPRLFSTLPKLPALPGFS